MFSLSEQHKYYYYTGICDMRKGFDGLSGIVMIQMRRQPTDGSVYIFINRRRDRMKLLVWQSHGFLLYYKRLERGTFELPLHENNQTTLQLNQEILSLMIRGIKLKKIERKTRYKKGVNI
jgi:transposase